MDNSNVDIKTLSGRHHVVTHVVEQVTTAARMLGTLRQVLSMPRASVTIRGDDEARAAYLAFVSPHPLFRFVHRKSLGVGLLQLPDEFNGYISGKHREYLRRQRNRCLRAGYTFAQVDALGHLDEILAVNRSAESRCGRPMDAAYVDESAVRAFFSARKHVYAVFESGGTLVAYAYTPIFGDVFILSRLMGHADHEDNGVMYLLVSEVMREMIDRGQRDGHPSWAMYDTFLGAPEGLVYFKRKLGFAPYRVTWRWSND